MYGCTVVRNVVVYLARTAERGREEGRRGGFLLHSSFYYGV